MCSPRPRAQGTRRRKKEEKKRKKKDTKDRKKKDKKERRKEKRKKEKHRKVRSFVSEARTRRFHQPPTGDFRRKKKSERLPNAGQKLICRARTRMMTLTTPTTQTCAEAPSLGVRSGENLL